MKSVICCSNQLNNFYEITKGYGCKVTPIFMFYFFMSLIVETAPFCSLLASTKVVPVLVMNQV